VEGLKVAEQRLGQGDTAGAERALDTCPQSRRGWEWDCLKKLCKTGQVTRRPYLETIHTHTDMARLTLPGDGRRPAGVLHGLLTGPYGVLTSPAGHYALAEWGHGHPAVDFVRIERIEVWDTDSRRRVSELPCHPPALHTVLSPDGRHFAIYRTEFRWEVFDSVTAAVIARLKDDDMVNPRIGAFSPDNGLFASVGIDQVSVWDAGTGERLYFLSRGGGFSPFLCFTPDSSRLLTSRPSSGEVVPHLPPDNASTDDIEIEPPEVSKRELLEVRVARTGQELVRLSFASEKVPGVGEISQDGSRLVVPRTVAGYSPRTGSEFVFQEPTSPTPTLATRLIVLLVAGAGEVVALFWLLRRLRAGRRSAQTRPSRPEDEAGTGTCT
jgi:hypothetical protein